MYTFADISNNNGSVDIAKLAAANVISGLHQKASEGTGFTDAYFASRRAACAEAGLRFGAYHYARPDRNPTEGGARVEAEHFCDVVGTLGRRDLRPALDYEVRGALNHYAWIRAFNEVVKHRLGVWPLFYSYLSLVQEIRLPVPVGAGLWLAQVGKDDKDHGYSIPSPWKHVSGHQYTWNGIEPGISGRVDLTHTNSLAAFLAHPRRRRK